MLDWLTDTVTLFGLSAHNWMLLVAGLFVVYILALAIPWRGRA